MYRKFSNLMSFAHGVGTSRWGEFGEGGLLWGECNGKSFDWFDGSPIDELLCKVYIFLLICIVESIVIVHFINCCYCAISCFIFFSIRFGYCFIILKIKGLHLSR